MRIVTAFLETVQLKNIFGLIFLFSVLGCTSTTTNSQRVSNNVNKTSLLNVLFADSTFEEKNIKGQFNVSRANADLSEFGTAFVDRASSEFNKSGINAAASRADAADPRLKSFGLGSVLGSSVAEAALLTIQPLTASTRCTGGCHVFRMRVTYYDYKSKKVVWTAVIDTPPKASRFSDFSAPADSFIAEIIKNLKAQALI